MAHRFEKGTHLYFPFKNGFTVQDSQCKPRYYLTKESLQNNLNESDYSEVVEYAPAVHSMWEPVSLDDQYEGIFRCINCKQERYFGDGYPSYYDGAYCPNCGAIMALE